MKTMKFNSYGNKYDLCIGVEEKKTMREMLDSYFDDMWDAVLSEAG